MYYLAIDPGNNTGWALFSATGEFLDMGEIKGHDAFLDWLEEKAPQLQALIVERYRVRTHGRHKFTNTMSDVPTLQLIGAIKRIARKNKLEVNEQDPSPALSIGLRFLGMSKAYEGKHVPDQVSALAHGTYFLRKAGITHG